MSDGKVWLITGCSTGIGRLLSERCLREGDRVVATARNVDTLSDLAGATDENCLRVRLDVHDAATIEAAVHAARDRFGRVDVLVNNAGYGYIATQEEADLDAVRNMFETNVFGLVAVTQAVLPEFRERGSGVVVNLSSMAGHMATPRVGFYQASKWAVEALSEALSMEVGSLGIRVVVVEPGRYETKFSTSAQLASAEEDPNSPYAALRGRWHAGAGTLFPDFQDPLEVVESTWQAVHGDDLLIRVPVGVDANLVVDRRQELGDSGFAEWMRSKLHPAM